MCRRKKEGQDKPIIEHLPPMNLLKKTILWIIIVLGVLMVYFSAYLPFAKSRAYIRAVRQTQQIKSFDEFKKIFDPVFNFYSPVGDEEVVKFLSNDILTLISQEQANEEVSRLLVEYIEPYFFDENVRHMITIARMYETLWRRWGGEEDYKKAEAYFLKAHDIGPKLPPVLYAMVSFYYSRGDFDKTRNIANEILKSWPNDERVKELLAQLP